MHCYRTVTMVVNVRLFQAPIAIALVSAVTSLVAGGSIESELPILRPPAVQAPVGDTPTQDVPTEEAPAKEAPAEQVCSVPSFGIAAGGPLNTLPRAELDTELAAMKDAGTSWVRFDIDWSAIESTKGKQNWEVTDQVVERARAQGLKILGVVAYTPEWARVPGAANTHGYPADIDAFAQFAQQAAQRYSSSISSWEIWNEPNIAAFFLPKPNVKVYAAMLKAASARIKEVQPSAQIVSGGLSPATDNGTDISPVTYLNGLYAAGAKSAFDVFGIHPYSWPDLPSDPASQSWNTFYRVRLMRDSMVRNGDSEKKVWATEFGAPTGTSRTAVSSQLQATIITDGFAQAEALGYMEKIFVYSMRDRGTNTSDREQNFGLMTIDYKPKPALAAVKEAISGCETPTT